MLDEMNSHDLDGAYVTVDPTIFTFKSILPSSFALVCEISVYVSLDFVDLTASLKRIQRSRLWKHLTFVFSAPQRGVHVLFLDLWNSALNRGSDLDES